MKWVPYNLHYRGYSLAGKAPTFLMIYCVTKYASKESPGKKVGYRALLFEVVATGTIAYS